MVDINYADGTPVPNPNIKDKRSHPNLSYHIDAKEKKHLDNVIERTTKYDSDYFELIDGTEGSGKSIKAMQQGKYVDPTLDLSRICFTADEFKQAVIKAKPLPKGATHPQCVIYDEAVTGLSAGDSIARIGKILKSLMMQMRQKNLFVIVVIPSIFELNKYTVLSRCRSFFHIYEAKGGKKGHFIGFNRKDTRLLYLKGKKTHSYTIRSRFRGKFFNIYVVPEQEYRKKKEEALEVLNETDGKSGDSRLGYERKIYLVWVFDLLNKLIKLENPDKPLIKVTEPAFCELLSRHGIEMKRVTFATHKANVRKVGKTLKVEGLVV